MKCSWYRKISTILGFMGWHPPCVASKLQIPICNLCAACGASWFSVQYMFGYKPLAKISVLATSSLALVTSLTLATSLLGAASLTLMSGVLWLGSKIVSSSWPVHPRCCKRKLSSLTRKRLSSNQIIWLHRSRLLQYRQEQLGNVVMSTS
jgi:hypothetical protein